jgi:hypothetical protein
LRSRMVRGERSVGVHKMDWLRLLSRSYARKAACC